MRYSLLILGLMFLASSPAQSARRWVRYRLQGTPFSLSIPGKWTTRGGATVSPVEKGRRWTMKKNLAKKQIIIPMPGGWIRAQYWRPNYLLSELAKVKERPLKTGKWKG